MSEETAEWLGGWADGLYTVAAHPTGLNRLMEAFRRGGGDKNSVHVKVDVSWAPSDAIALRQAHAQWRSNVVGGTAAGDWRQPEDFERAACDVSPEKVCETVLVSADPRRHVDHLQGFVDLGVASIDVHAVAGEQTEFMEVYGAEMLPAVRRSA